MKKTIKSIFLTGLFLCFILSCTRDTPANTSSLITWSGAYPLAVLESGENPLWFKLTEEGPVHIRTIEDVKDYFAFVPWPYSPHIRFFNENTDGIIMAVNRYGFLKLSPNTDRQRGIFLYCFPAGEFWLEYTVGGFVFYNEQPAVVLYFDDRFLTTSLPPPNPRTWSFNMNSNVPFPIDIPLLRRFPENELWNIDTVRLADDGFFYYRAARRNAASPLVLMFRTANLTQAGEEISAETFFNSAPRQIIYSHPLLPPLPEGFVYTGIGRVGGDSLFASWEEQEDFSIGVAGFVLIRL
jgi:hypothetical protein